ncbi:putative taurine transporter subunit; membrane component of ABC superfamily [Mesorhizobium plurifarium]|uniref:Putative taurine transporter subunit membrane component of ABC superfamily n=1 Tax=Mesorhizobium plurifarium TaxID=69974 RepID=A0A090GC43_MESPL|nr:putative taurine transporter subunit; membrane component of ABC superfamily [Mesorhizobium plurifarium]
MSAVSLTGAKAAGPTRFGGALVYLRTMALFVLAWYVGSLFVPSKLLLPSPLAVAAALRDTALNGELFGNALISLARLLASLLAAAAIAVPLGLLMGRSRLWNDLLELPVEMLRPIAGIAWIPLALYLFGIGHRLPLFIMFYTAFFPLLVGTAAGAAAVDKRLIAAARTMGLSGPTIMRRVIVPAALPAILVSARLAVAASWTAVVAAELVGAPNGLGYAIEYYRSMLSTPTVMAFIVTIGVLGFLTDKGLRQLSKVLTPWAQMGAAR